MRARSVLKALGVCAAAAGCAAAPASAQVSATTAPVTSLSGLSSTQLTDLGLANAQGIPAGASLLQVTLSNAPAAGDTIQLSCPSGSIPAAWGNGWVLDTPGTGTGPSTFGFMPVSGISLTGYVLCRPYAATKVTLLKTKKVPFTGAFGRTQLTKGAKVPKGFEFVQITATGLQSGIQSIAPSVACPQGKHTDYELVTVSGPSATSSGLNVLVQPTGSATSATFFGACFDAPN